MNRFNLSMLLLLVTVLVFSGQSFSKTVEPEANQIILETKGIVCTFCAYGAETNLRKLDIVNQRTGENKGMFTDVEKGVTTMYIHPDKQIDFERIIKTVKDSGFGVERIHVNIQGKVDKKDGKTILTNSNNNQAFEISGENAGALNAGKIFHIYASLDVNAFNSTKQKNPYQLSIEKIIK